ncbi:hypothetical protein [Kribbella sp. NBC_00889]|uniref:hypothetical protein n=1 Tax=Kribbella sp. NBC_00889 TaxID=2975974 RepID=UPI0038705040|nr:hypothetical protein OG817_31185 [Kribbella sp. NBC_00889]
MTERVKDEMAVYDAWKRLIEKSDGFIENDGRFPDGTLVWTPFGFEADVSHGIPADYCDPQWGWYQGRVLGQSDTNTWDVFMNHQGLPFLCERYVNDLRQVVVPGNGSNS